MTPQHWPNGTTREKRRSLDKSWHEHRPEIRQGHQQSPNHRHRPHHQDNEEDHPRTSHGPCITGQTESTTRTEDLRASIVHQKPPVSSEMKSPEWHCSKSEGNIAFKGALTQQRCATFGPVEYLASFQIIWKPSI